MARARSMGRAGRVIAWLAFTTHASGVATLLAAAAGATRLRAVDRVVLLADWLPFSSAASPPRSSQATCLTLSLSPFNCRDVHFDAS